MKYKINTVCTKCGNNSAESKHTPEKTFADKFIIPPHIKRTCRNCGWVWSEEPLDFNREEWEKEAIKNHKTAMRKNEH